MASRPSSPTGFEMADALSGLVLIDTNDLSKCGSPFARVPSLVLLDLTAHEKTTHNSAVNNDEINLEVDSDEEQAQEAFDTSTKEALHALFTEFDTSGDGHIDAKELLVFLHRLPEMAGMKLPTDFTVEEANLCMQGFDLDHNGTIEEEELMQWISDGLAKTAAERITFSLSSPFAAKLNIFLSSASKVIAAHMYRGSGETEDAKDTREKYVQRGTYDCEDSEDSEDSEDADDSLVYNETLTVHLHNKQQWGFKLYTMKEGALILFSVDPGERGYEAGIRNGDVLKQVGEEIIDTETAKEAYDAIVLEKVKSSHFGKTGETVAVKIVRSFLDCRLPANKPWGFTLEELNDHTLQVKSADQGEHGYKAGIRNGDCLVRVGGEKLPPLCSAKEAFAIIKKHKTEAEEWLKIVLRRPAAVPVEKTGKHQSMLFRDQSVVRQEQRNANHLEHQLESTAE